MFVKDYVLFIVVLKFLYVGIRIYIYKVCSMVCRSLSVSLR